MLQTWLALGMGPAYYAQTMRRLCADAIMARGRIKHKPEDRNPILPKHHTTHIEIIRKSIEILRDFIEILGKSIDINGFPKDFNGFPKDSNGHPKGFNELPQEFHDPPMRPDGIQGVPQGLTISIGE